MKNVDVGSFLRVSWWIWLFLILLTLVGGWMWYQNSGEIEPVIVIISTFAALIFEGIAFLRAWQDRQEGLQKLAEIKQSIAHDGDMTRQMVDSGFKETRHLIEKQKQNIQDPKYKRDLNLLKQVWFWLNSEKIEQLISHTRGGMLNANFFYSFDDYFKKRKRPENQFFNADFQEKLEEFDKVFAQLTNKILDATSQEEWRGELTLKPRYRNPIDPEDAKRAWNELSAALNEFEKMLRDLVKVMKQTFPEFDFRVESNETLELAESNSAAITGSGSWDEIGGKSANWVSSTTPLKLALDELSILVELTRNIMKTYSTDGGYNGSNSWKREQEEKYAENRKTILDYPDEKVVKLAPRILKTNESLSSVRNFLQDEGGYAKRREYLDEEFASLLKYLKDRMIN